MIFGWALAAMVGPPSEQQLVRLDDRHQVHNGDRLKMLVKPVSACWIYVVHQSPGDEITLLFPERSRLGKALRRGRAYEAPASSWFQLDEETGRETVRLVASAQRLESLERLLTEHAGAEGKARSALAQRIRGEIDALTQPLARTAQRPIPIAGTVRGRAEEWQDQLRQWIVELAGHGVVGRTIVLDHRS